MSVFPANFPILCLPGDKLFQSKDVEEAYCLPPVVHAFHGNKVDTGKKLRQREWQGLCPLAVSLIGDDQLPPLWTHPPHRKRLCARKQTSSKAPCRRAAQTHSDTSVATPESVDASGIPPSQQQPRPLASSLPSLPCPMWTTCQPATPHLSRSSPC